MPEAHGLSAAVDTDFERIQRHARALDPSSAAADPVLRSIAEHSPDLIMVLDRHAVIRFINRTVPDLSMEQVIGQHIYLYVPAEQRQVTREHYEYVARTAQPTQFESVYIAENGSCSYWS